MVNAVGEGRRGGERGITRNSLVKECPQEVISVATQVAASGDLIQVGARTKTESGIAGGLS